MRASLSIFLIFLCSLVFCSNLSADEPASIDSNCVALWRFDQNTLTTDSIGTNTLTNNNAIDSNLLDFKQGDGSADLEAGNSHYFSIADADLDNDFPLKSSSSNKSFTVSGWIKPESFTVNYARIFGKWQTARPYTFVIYLDSRRLSMALGYNNGYSCTLLNHPTQLAADRWYHFGVTYDNSTKNYRIRIWDDTNQAIVGTDLTGTWNQDLFVGTDDITIGADAAPSYHYDGKIDELAVFNRVLSGPEIDQFRQGGLSGSTDNVAPVLVNTSPTDGASLEQIQQITVTLADTDNQSAIDDAAVISSFSVKDQNQQAVYGTISESDDTFTFSPVTLPLADGTYTVSLDAADIYGNTQNYSFAFTVDSMAPVKPVITGGSVTSGTLQAQPVLNSTNQFIIELTGTRESDTSVWINGGLKVDFGENDWSVPLNLVPGFNSIEVWLKDRAGNQGASEWVDINVSTADAVKYEYDDAGRVKSIHSNQ